MPGLVAVPGKVFDREHREQKHCCCSRLFPVRSRFVTQAIRQARPVAAELGGVFPV